MPSNTPNKPAIDYPFQSIPANRTLTERSSAWGGTFTPVEPGTPFANLNHSVQEATQFAGSIFLGQRMGKDDEWQERIWADAPSLQDVYNYAQDDSSDHPDFPIFTRQYLELRDQYPALRRTRLSAFTGIYAIRVISGGTGYSTDPNNPPTVTITDSGTGAGATAIALVDPSTGALVKITLRSEGQNYTPTTTTVTITDVAGGTGVGATAGAVVQAANCLLVSEKAVSAPTPWNSLYLLVTRVYQTLPGPVVTSTSTYGQIGFPVIVSKQEISADAVFQTGEFLPAAINVSAISTGATVTVTLASDHNLPPGAWVVFAGTNSTPTINGTLQILSAPASNKVTVTPSAPVTVAGTAAGTFQSKNYVQRDIKATENANIKVKVDSIVAIPDISTYNETVQSWENYSFPDFLNYIVFYGEASGSGVVGTSIQDGYHGPCRSIRDRYLFMGPPPDSFQAQFVPTIIIPSSGTFTILSGALGPVKIGRFPPLLTGPSPSFNQNPLIGNAVSITSIGTSGTGTPAVVLASNPVFGSLNALIGMRVTITGSNSTPSIDGTWPIVSALDSPLTLVPGTGLNITGAGTTGTAQLVGGYTAGTTATAFIDLPVSTPPVIVATLSVTATTTGATVDVTLSGTHYLKPGQFIQLSGTNSTPSLDGFFIVQSVPAVNKVRLAPPAAITVAATAGTMQNYITVITEPERLGVAGVQISYVRHLKVPYTSGQVPNVV
jgi:hypothetical protein